jgi:hypothetical protein
VPALLLALAPNALGDQPASDFLPEAETAWRAYGKFAEKLQGSVKSTFYSFGQGKRTVDRVVRGEYKRCGARALWTTLVTEDATGNKANRGSAKVVTGTGAFRLTRKDDASPWVLTHYSASEPNPDWLQPLTPQGAVARETQVGLHLWGVHLSELTRKPDFSFTKGAREQRDGREQVRLDFVFRPRDKSHLPFREGWIRLDPARSWLMTEYQFDGPGETKVRYHGSFDYAQGPGGLPVVTRFREHTERIGGEKPGPVGEMELEYDLHEQDSVPAEEFSLAAFGLPEPTRRRQWPTYWYLVGAGLACLLLSAAFRWRGRRAAAA